MFGADRLVANAVRDKLKPESSEADQKNQTAAAEMARAFSNWVVAFQQYQHAPGTEHLGDVSPVLRPPSSLWKCSARDRRIFVG